ncbi:LOG family protein [Alteromonas sp. V450]|uniref:nucleotide 5'-monophosphate nucleosidase PpnN n=1 Tax=Alteromonas sp. V450 TaxID=1912139 RepID=UPI0008FF60C4|nr:nucleotide 5'-monophosphate nucleosidase PpnN [Alteromonas sp. V450]OJF70692.1 LOG family protein [Alteromonas sp. V450]
MKKVQLNPVGWMSQLSQVEVAQLQDATNSELFSMFRNCSLAVLNSGVDEDNFEALFAPYDNFEIRLVRRERGVKIELVNPPEVAFVDEQLVRGVHEHLFAVLRDLLYMGNKYTLLHQDSPIESNEITDMVFDMLRHAKALEGNDSVNTVVCWGGHSINQTEYKYTKEVGYQLGLRGMNICTGCGPGAMKGPMKGATIGHAKQRNKTGRYIGISEPSIIAAEPPNAIVNELIIMPDIEKRLEAFVRLGHGIIVFPGGVGTAEELLYLLGILTDERNAQQPFPVVLTGPAGSEQYFEAIDTFVADTLGPEAQSKYEIIIDDPLEVAKTMNAGLQKVKKFRGAMGDAYSFNWLLKIEHDFQHPFIPTHESMAALALHKNQSKSDLASNLRKAFSGIVAGNVKAEGIRQIKQKGPFELTGDAVLMGKVDQLLESFVAQHRMKLPGSAYTPCYVVKNT